MSPKAQTAPQHDRTTAADDRQRLEARIAAARETGAALATEVVTTAKKLGRPAEKNRPAPKGTRSILEWAKKPEVKVEAEVKVEVEDKKIVKTEPQP